MTRTKDPLRNQGDPTLFFNGFRDSVTYSNALSSFLAGKQLDRDVVFSEKVEAFEASIAAKNALVDYAEHDTRFALNTELLAGNTRGSMEGYISFVRYINSRYSPSRDEIEAMDEARSRRHVEIAKALVADGIVPNILMGRVIARLALICEGLETYDDARAMR